MSVINIFKKEEHTMNPLLLAFDIISIFCLTYVSVFLYLERKRILKFLEEQDEDTKE